MWQVIKQFPLPSELKDGIVYCQRALRDVVLQHQNLASKINILPKHQRVRVKQFMLELEREIVDIGNEQAALVRVLSQRLTAFRVYALEKTNIDISDEIANGYVSRLLHVHNESFGQTNSVPVNCTKRPSASELERKYCLENFTQLGKFVDDDNANFGAWNTTLQEQQKADEKTIKNETKTFLIASGANSSSSSSSQSPVAAPASRSLLKPKQERLKQEQETLANEVRAFASVIESENGRRRSAEAKLVDDKIEDFVEAATDTARKKAEPKRAASTQNESQPCPRRGTWMPGLRGRPPKGVKYIPPAKLATIQGQGRETYLRKIHHLITRPRQRGRPPKFTAKVSVVPPQSPPPEADQDPEAENDSSEDQSASIAFERPSAAIRRGRSNLQLALNRVKSRQPSNGDYAEQCINTAATEMAKKSKRPSGSKMIKHGSSGSSGSSPSSRSSTPTLQMGRLAASDDSSDRRFELPAIAEPDVPPPNDIWELGMKALLNYFGLCTPEEAKARRERRQERKRRSCYSTERKDFHYGRFDYYEQQQQLQAASRSSKRPNQRPVLYSPPVAIAKKRKLQQQQQQQLSVVRAARNVALPGNTRQRLPMRCVSLDSRDIFAAMSNRRCFVCNKTGSTLELSACTNCCNIYHISCHRSEMKDDAQLLRHRDNLCPVCLTAEDDGDK